jgi:CheY-like chemotaxis protein
LLDYSLPGQNGIEVLKMIRRRRPHLPVILLTGQGNEAIAAQSIKEGAQDYIVKGSITAETLSHAVRASIEITALKQRVDEQHVSLEIFTRAMAYDLEEPVQAVRAFARMVCGSETDATMRAEYIRHILDAAERMTALVDTLLSYTQSDRFGEPGPKVSNLDEAVDTANNAMFRGIWLGDIALVRRALKEGANPNTENVHLGKRALHMAAQTGNLDIIAQILECKGVNVTCEDRAGKNAINLAREYRHAAAEALLMGHVKAYPERYKISGGSIS